jgi:hypothetical protein
MKTMKKGLKLRSDLKLPGEVLQRVKSTYGDTFYLTSKVLGETGYQNDWIRYVRRERVRHIFKKQYVCTIVVLRQRGVRTIKVSYYATAPSDGPLLRIGCKLFMGSSVEKIRSWAFAPTKRRKSK